MDFHENGEVLPLPMSYLILHTSNDEVVQLMCLLVSMYQHQLEGSLAILLKSSGRLLTPFGLPT